MASPRAIVLRPNALSVKLMAAFALSAILFPQINTLHSPAMVLPVPVFRLHWTQHRIPYFETQYDRWINEAAQENHLDPLLIKAIISVESDFNPHCVSPAGACGLMQLMPSTARLQGINNIFDPEQNIKAGTRHFKYLLNRFHQLNITLAAYNAGEVPVMRHHGIPPFRETRWYVHHVLSRYETYQIKAQVKPKNSIQSA